MAEEQTIEMLLPGKGQLRLGMQRNAVDVLQNSAK
jgi:hypothetical protein